MRVVNVDANIYVRERITCPPFSGLRTRVTMKKTILAFLVGVIGLVWFSSAL